MSHDPNCIFCKISKGEIPSSIFYQDDEVIAFHDIRPAAPVHFLIVPREHIPRLQDSGSDHQALLGKMLLLAPKLAAEQGVTNGFRVVINNGEDGGQEVYHLHVHVMGGPRPWKIG
ncbi:MAG TPA: histidine triad nucleotide-binding protein [Aquabacterium sp.]|uniref:histidine triad nucleotide-binding protein n=1 Tax=Aquabacterium sp. TaxID=1872578 RepID=UPI002DA217B4|nr:histidine triad nucleotide-binding protein [Aquabacterium sp.]HET6788472.1 histidine triad nucleotide-binding protein [Aquabacterium sp.]HEX5372764.1 histidine triad nucleotide-binding protein [Aquabacterium sp.]